VRYVEKQGEGVDGEMAVFLKAARKELFKSGDQPEGSRGVMRGWSATPWGVF